MTTDTALGVTKRVIVDLGSFLNPYSSYTWLSCARTNSTARGYPIRCASRHMLSGRDWGVLIVLSRRTSTIVSAGLPNDPVQCTRERRNAFPYVSDFLNWVVCHNVIASFRTPRLHDCPKHQRRAASASRYEGASSSRSRSELRILKPKRWKYGWPLLNKNWS